MQRKAARLPAYRRLTCSTPKALPHSLSANSLFALLNQLVATVRFPIQTHNHALNNPQGAFKLLFALRTMIRTSTNQHSWDELSVASREGEFNSCVRSVWFFVHLRNCVLGMQVLCCTEKQTLRTMREKLALGTSASIVASNSSNSTA